MPFFIEINNKIRVFELDSIAHELKIKTVA